MNDTPRGATSLLYQESTLFEQLEMALLDLFSLWGFNRAITPTIEFRDTLTKGLDETGRRCVITFVDPVGGGRPLALRSDVTPQIARLAATTLAQRPLPLRLSYAETVFRSVTPGQGARMELSQAGVELLGVSSPEADAELIALAVEALDVVGFADVSLSVGHVGYLTALLDALDASPERLARVKEALVKKDAAGLTAALDGASGPAVDALTAIVGRWGRIEDAPSVGAATDDALAHLTKVAEALDRYGVAERVSFDLTEARGFGYYSGVTFEGFVKGIAWPVITGGRYDRLVAVYGRDLPGAGFAVDTGRVRDAHAERGEPDDWAAADILVVGMNDTGLDAASLARALREEGLAASRDLIRRPLAESLELARRMNISLVAVTGADDAPAAGLVKLIDMISGDDRFTDVNGLFDLLDRSE